MAKILFITDVIFEFVAISYLSAFLKQHNHEVDVLSLEELKKKDSLIESVRAINPDAVAFSITSFGYEWSIEVAKKIKEELDIPNIFGGSHPTFFPEFINNSHVNAICIGEGEYAILDYANSLDADGEGITKIKNVWIKKDGKIFKNEVRPLIDLDDLPYPDRDLFYEKYKFIRDFSNKRIHVTRGCPYNCHFCFNSAYREIYKDTGKYVRRRDPQKIIEEIKNVKEKYGFKTLSFMDENFTTNKKWAYELLDLYKKEIGMPFMVLGRFNELNDEMIRKLKESGCYSISVGVETGSERIRNEILNKHLTDEQIIKGAKLLKKYGIEMFTYNMIGLPTETLDDAFKTLELNVKIGADITALTILQPLKGTQICDYIKKHDLIIPGIDIENLDSHYSGIVLKLDNTKEMCNLHNLFMLGIWFPRLIPLIRILVKFPRNPFYHVFFKFTLLLKFVKTRRLGWWETIRAGYHMRNYV